MRTGRTFHAPNSRCKNTWGRVMFHLMVLPGVGQTCSLQSISTESSLLVPDVFLIYFMPEEFFVRLHGAVKYISPSMPEHHP